MHSACDWVVPETSATARTKQNLEVAMDKPPDVRVEQDREKDDTDSPAVGEAIPKVCAFCRDPTPVTAYWGHRIERDGHDTGDGGNDPCRGTDDCFCPDRHVGKVRLASNSQERNEDDCENGEVHSLYSELPDEAVGGTSWTGAQLLGPNVDEARYRVVQRVYEFCSRAVDQSVFLSGNETHQCMRTKNTGLWHLINAGRGRTGGREVQDQGVSERVLLVPENQIREQHKRCGNARGHAASQRESGNKIIVGHVGRRSSPWIRTKEPELRRLWCRRD